MTTAPTYADAAAGRRVAETTSVGVIAALSASHMLNDTMQSLAPALYPVFARELSLSFFQIGVITFVFQLTASLLQPLIGFALDRRPLNAILPVGMAFTVVGLLLLAYAGDYPLILLSVAVIGIGSAVFHPEASRVARAASGGRHGFAQSLFQVGGNFGQSMGPLLAAFVVVPFGQHSVLAFTVLALIAVALLTGVSRWHAARRAERRHASAAKQDPTHPRAVVFRTLAVLIVMLFSKVLYLASIGSYYTFYLIATFHLSIQQAQVTLFVFLASVAAGTFLGGPLADRIGAKFVIWGSILGVLPFTLLLPHLGLVGTIVEFDRDRARDLLGLLRDDRLCARADARQCRDGRRTFLRPQLRPRRNRGGAARHSGRPDEHRLRLSGLRLPARGRPARRVSAEPAARAQRREASSNLSFLPNRRGRLALLRSRLTRRLPGRASKEAASLPCRARGPAENIRGRRCRRLLPAEMKPQCPGTE